MGIRCVVFKKKRALGVKVLSITLDVVTDSLVGYGYLGCAWVSSRAWRAKDGPRDGARTEA